MAVQALILAAGRGSRLGTVQGGIPKPLLQVGHKTLINHMLSTLSDAGIGPVTMVLGYSADEIRETVGVQAEYIINPYWETTNSLYSFSLAKDKISGPLFILNCDLLLHPEILERLLSAGEDSLAFDSSSGGAREQMAVKLRGGMVQDMSKEMKGDEASGENVGVLYFSGETAEMLFDEAGRVLESGGKKLWLGSAVKEVALKREIRGVDIAGLPWAEIDFPSDLDYARREVLPKIAEAGSKKGMWRRILKWGIPAAAIGILSVFLFRGFLPSSTVNWSTVDASGGEKVKVQFERGLRDWWVIGVGESAMTDEMTGPDRIRIETRLLMDRETDDRVPYVIEVSVNGIRKEWYKFNARQSKTTEYSGLPVGKRRRIKVDIPEGRSRVTVRLIAAEGPSCLVRFRRIEEDVE